MVKVVQEESVVSSVVNPALVASGVHADFLKARIDVGSVVVQLYRSLGGIQWDKERRGWVKVGESLCPERLLEKFASILNAYCNPNTIHGNITEQEAHDITFDLCEEIAFLLAFEGPDLGVRQEDVGIILRTIETIVYMTLTRAINDGERTHEDDTFKSVQSSNSKLLDGRVKV